MAIKMVMDGDVIFTTDSSVDSYILSPKLKLEVNKSGSLEFIVLPNDYHYNDFHILKTVIWVYEDEDIIFRGRVITTSSDFFMQKTVTCEGDISFLLDSIMEPYKGTESVSAFFSRVITNHNAQMGSETFKKFSVGNVTVPGASSSKEFDVSSLEDSSSVVNSNLLDEYGGILKTRYEDDTVYLDYIPDPYQSISSYSVNSQDIAFGVNLLDIESEPPIDDIFTILYPIGKDESVNISSVNDGSKLLAHSAAVEKYGRIVRSEQWSEITTPSELLSVAQTFLNVHAAIYPDDLTIKAIDLHLLDPENNQSLRLLDRIRCYSEPHGDGSNPLDIVLICLAIEYDFLNPENNSYKIGSYIPSDNASRNRGTKGTSLSEKSMEDAKKAKKGISGNGRATEQNADDIEHLKMGKIIRTTSVGTIEVSLNPDVHGKVDLTTLFEGFE